MRKPYVDYEDDETCLPLNGTRDYKNVKLGTDYAYRWRTKNTITDTM